ncbi:uncharacterized protein LOC117331073 [Pecten maximus]|uniref:uncharacterized protein LOC117331073 n=1 Tax=Pecten maximus TaxID=6579 RepID=UPI0014580070|nr:uncharacterized protein LOC117331073 [Pecten maximus]
MFLFRSGFGSISLTVLYINILIVSSNVFGDRNGKGELKTNNKETTFILRAQKYSNDNYYNDTARLYGRHPRKAVAELPLTKNINRKVDKSLVEEFHSFIKPLGGSVQFDCSTRATRTIFRQYARASRQWVHNNNALNIENDRMLYQMGLLAIQNLKTTDQGIYICRIEYEPMQFKSVALFTLIVKSNEPDVRVQETSVLALQSFSAPLGYLYPSATRAWWVNDRIFSSKIPASQTNDDRFFNANKSFEGIWTCTVSHKTNDRPTRTWKTARYVVKLTPPPSKLEKLLTYCSTHPVTTVMYFLVFAGFLLVVFIGCVYSADKVKMSAQTEMDSMKERLLSCKDNSKDLDYSYDASQPNPNNDRFSKENGEIYYQQENYQEILPA